MKTRCNMRNLASICFGFFALWVTPLLAYEISSSARVNDDGTLRINGKTIHLYGLHIPKTNRTCSSNRLPPVCGSRASVALDFKIQGFVRCEIMNRNSDGSLIGWCRVKATYFDEGVDLSAYLLERGWAVALPDAPFEYQTLEKIARTRQFGIWGTPVDRINPRP
jgi:endonuclease YncB( thermonuclease family)